MSIAYVPFSELFEFLPKSKRKAGDGRESGQYPFYTSSQETIKKTDEPDYEADALVFGTGGSASVHYAQEPFSTSGDCLVAVARDRKSTNTSTYYRYLTSKIHLIEVGFRGAGLKHVSKTFLSELLIPKLDHDVQNGIAAILDKADAIRRKRQQAIQLADEFLRAVFLDMFGDPSSNPKSWKTAPIKSFGEIVTGNTPSRKQPEYYGGHIEWIKSDNINTPSHFLTPASEYLSGSGRAVARTAPAGSILVTCIAGSRDCIGNVALADREVAFNQQINAIIPNDNVNKWFLYGQILFAKTLIQSASTNSMKGMVSKSKFEQIEVLNPPERLQCKFGDIFQKHSELTDNLRTLYGKSQETFSSIAQRAFRGDL